MLRETLACHRQRGQRCFCCLVRGSGTLFLMGTILILGMGTGGCKTKEEDSPSRAVSTSGGPVLESKISRGFLVASKPIKPTGIVHRVVLSNIEFKPNRIRISPGDTLRFTNKDAFKHDVYMVRTANPNQVLIPATNVLPGKTVEVVLKREGLFDLYCTIHGGMTGKITTTGSFELTEEEKKRAAAVREVSPIAKRGEKLFWAKAQCFRCHQVGNRGEGLRGPNLKDIGLRANFRSKDLNLESGTAYILQSLLDPSAHIVEGYSDDMPKVYQSPMDLNAEELTAIVTYLQSQGGEVDEWAIDIDDQQLAGEFSFNPFSAGMPSQGRVVFKKMGCGSCHTVGSNRAVSAGPDLTSIGAFRPWTWLAQSIITPNSEIGANWKSVVVHLMSGEKIPGILRGENDREVKLLVRSDDQFKAIRREEIERIEHEKGTRMPNNYRDLMSVHEMADLISYLESLNTP